MKVSKSSFINTTSFSLWRYEGVIRRAIISIKYKFAYSVSSELSAVCVNELKIRKFFVNKNIILLPIPLHRSRQNWRGFNQSGLIGRKIAMEMGWKYSPDLLIRTTSTRPQVGLSKEDRLKNLKKVFELNKNIKLEKDKIYIIFDDVWTTGSTINEARKVLLKNRVEKVFSLTIAR